jgi:hypothetical protein
MTRKGLWFLVVLCLGMIVGALWQNAVDTVPARRAGSLTQMRVPMPGDSETLPPDSETPSADFDSAHLDELLDRLDEARRREQRREQTLADLQARVDRLETLMGGARSDEPSEAPDTGTPEPAAGGSQVQGKAALIAAGIDGQTADWIQQQLDKRQLDELFLRNQAIREGWINTPRFRNALAKLKSGFNALRGEIGDDDFDRLLFAVGRNNRVAISEVMNNSPAQQFGLNAGDTIIRYDGKRILSAQELQALTAEGDTASPVLVEIVRQGQAMSLYVSGGPLGVRLTSRRERPE